MKRSLSIIFLLIFIISASQSYAQIPEGYTSIYALQGEAERTDVAVGAGATYQILGPGADWNQNSNWDFSKFRKLVINITFAPEDAGKQIAVRFNANTTAVRLEMFTLPATGTSFSAEIDLQKYAADGKVGLGGMIFYNGASHWSFSYDGSPATQPVTIHFVAVGDEIVDEPGETPKIPEGYVSIYALYGEDEKTPLEVAATSTAQLAGPANGWGDLSDRDYTKYRKLVLNITFDPADAGNQVAVRFNVNADPPSANVKLEVFTLPAEGTNFSAVIDLTKYAQDGKLGVGGIVFYNGATHWSFTYDGTATTKAVTINYVAVGDEIIVLPTIPEGYFSIYELKDEPELTPLEVAAKASSQLAGPAAGWGDLSDRDYSNFENLIINLTFDPADAGNEIAFRFNVNANPPNANVKLEKFTYPSEGTNFTAVIDLTKYAENGKVGVGGIVFYNGATHWSFNYDGTPASKAVTINYIAVGPEKEAPKPVTELAVKKILDGTITDDADYKVVAFMNWDTDSIYMVFEVNDDILYDGATNAWDNDNIEIYFDMDNSKNPLWPRNTGWPNTSLDTNDRQLRILPGKTWEAYNSITGVKLTTTMKDGGYDIHVNIPWSSLLDGFLPAAGTKIGFDILASDNDGDGRNQISWYSSSLMLWNDASYWGTLELVADGTFLSVPDVTAPDQPVVTATVESSKVTLAWDRPEDNIAVWYYTVKQDDVVVAEKMFAKKTGETFVVNNLADGTYKFNVTAFDNSGNSAVSAEVEAVINTTSVVEFTGGFRVYPNPSNGVVNIETGSVATSVLDVYNLSGQRIMRKTFVNHSSVDLSGLGQGIYIFNVITENRINTIKVENR